MGKKAYLLASVLIVFMTICGLFYTTSTISFVKTTSKDVTEHRTLLVFGSVTYEYLWLNTVLFAKLPNIDVRVKYKQHSEIEGHFESLRNETQLFQPIVIVSSINVPAVMDKYFDDPFFTDYLKSYVILVILSDEGHSGNRLHYSNCKQVYRNYGGDMGLFRDIYDNNLDQTNLNVSDAWFPLGFSSNLLPADSTILPISSRTFLYFWSASLAGKPERSMFLTRLNGSQIKDLGVLNTYDTFQGDMASKKFVDRVAYSQGLANAKVIPCPAGGSPEQFRISETLEMGGTLLVRSGHADLAYLDYLKFQYLKVETFDSDEAISILEQVASGKMDATLQVWQDENTKIWNRVKERLGMQFAQIIEY